MGKAVTPKEPLSDLEERFALEFLGCLNATQAYLRVKPAVKYTTAKTEGARLHAEPRVQQRVAELAKAVESKAILSAQEVLIGFSEIARTDPRDVWKDQREEGGGLELRNLSDLPPEVAGAIQEIEISQGKFGPRYRVKMYPRDSAYKALGEYRKVLAPAAGGWMFPTPPVMDLDEWCRRYSPAPSPVAAGGVKGVGAAPAPGNGAKP